jgi:hypothetical protein
MENLTRFLNLVRAMDAGAKAQAGHQLVVFKLVNGGRKFVRIVEDGEVMPWQWLSGLTAANVSYAVSTNRSLRHTFTKDIDHASPGHSFTMECSFLFAVDNARILVERLDDDPVRRVENELKLRLVQSARIIPWPELSEDVRRTAGKNVTHWVLDGQVDTIAAGGETRLLQYMHAFSKSYGIALGEITIVWRLAAREVEPAVAEVEVDRNLSLLQTQQRMKQAEVDAEGGLNKQRRMYDADEREYERQQRARDSFYTHLDEALGGVARNVDSMDKLAKAVQGGRQLFDPRPRPALSSGDGEVIAALPETTGGSALATTLSEIVRLTEDLDIAPATKRELVGSLLHIIAETYAAGEDSVERLNKYRDRLSAVLRPLTGVLSSEQFSTLRRVSDPAILKDRLK